MGEDLNEKLTHTMPDISGMTPFYIRAISRFKSKPFRKNILESFGPGGGGE
jgi:hypothetical protein